MGVERHERPAINGCGPWRVLGRMDSGPSGFFWLNPHPPTPPHKGEGSTRPSSLPPTVTPQIHGVQPASLAPCLSPSGMDAGIKFRHDDGGGGARENNTKAEKCLDIRQMFLYCSAHLPPTSEVCTNRRCMGVKRFPSRLAVLTSSRERSGRAARRPWGETSSAPYCKPGRPEVPSVYLEGIWLHKTGCGESGGMSR